MDYITYTVKQVSDMLKVHQETVRRWIRENKLEKLRGFAGRECIITKSELNKFLSEYPKYKDRIKENDKNKKREILFISGPMSGIPEYNHPAFFEAEKILRERYPDAGILNPAKLPTNLNKENYMPIDLAMVHEADIIFVLPGWETAEGCKIETEYAKKLGKIILKLR